MVLLSNDAMLYSFFMSKFKKIIKQITEEVYKMLRESMLDKVYRPHEPAYYERQGDNGGLLGSWNKELKSTWNTIDSLIEHDPKKLNISPEEFIHGSEYWWATDIRSDLVDIITQSGEGRFGKSGSLFGNGWWRRPRDFWTPIFKKIEGQWVDKRFQQLMKENGIKFVKTFGYSSVTYRHPKNISNNPPKY